MYWSLQVYTRLNLRRQVTFNHPDQLLSVSYNTWYLVPRFQSPHIHTVGLLAQSPSRLGRWMPHLGLLRLDLSPTLPYIVHWMQHHLLHFISICCILLTIPLASCLSKFGYLNKLHVAEKYVHYCRNTSIISETLESSDAMGIWTAELYDEVGDFTIWGSWFLTRFFV